LQGKNFLIIFDKNSSKIMTNNIFFLDCSEVTKIEIFDFVKIPPISKSHKLQYGTYAISVPPGIPDI
jgi:hypothetical protein